MPEEQKTPTTSVAKKNVGHRFEIGHPRWGGKRKNSTQQVRDMCAEMDVDPMRFMLSLIKEGVTTQVVIKNGRKTKVEVVADLATRTDLAKYVSRFLYPTLTTTAVTGSDGEGPVEIAALNLTAIMSNPELCRSAENLAMALAESEIAALDADADQPQKLLPGPMERDQQGHWKE